MRNRILSILLCLCMATCMLPTVAFAADTGKAIRLGTDALNKNVNTAAAPIVYFGQDHENNPGAWRVFGYNGSGGGQHDCRRIFCHCRKKSAGGNSCYCGRNFTFEQHSFDFVHCTEKEKRSCLRLRNGGRKK